MKRFAAFVFLLVPISAACADTPSFTFGGERYIQKFEVKGRAPNAQIEFGLADEPLKEWTKLVTLHSFTRNGNDAARAAARLANLVRERYKDAKYKVITNPKTSEAIIELSHPGREQRADGVQRFQIHTRRRRTRGAAVRATREARRDRRRGIGRDSQARD